MASQIRIERSAAKALRKLPAHIRSRIVSAIDALAEEPRPHGVKALDAATKLYRVRVGAYRIVYQIQDAALIIVIVRVGDRKEVYRRIDDLIKRTPPPT